MDINVVLAKKIDIKNINVLLPSFYTNYKNETKIGYLLLHYLYYQFLGNPLNINDIVKDKNNKPIFLNKNLFFNISHSKDYVCCCLAPINIGIDIEQPRKINQNSLKRFLHKDDNNYNNNYLKVWNVKEAYSKFLGVGLKLNFANLSINNIKQNANVYNFLYEIEKDTIYGCICFDKNINLNVNINFLDNILPQ